MSSGRSERARHVHRGAGDEARVAAERSEGSGRSRRGPRLGGYFLRFAVASIALFALYRWAEVTGAFQHVNQWNAIASGALLRLVGIGNERSGAVLEFGSGGLQIISECSAIYVLILFAAAVLAFPTRWQARLWGLALGVPCILAINVLRLATLGAVVRYRADLLPFFHEYLWQVLFVLVVAVLYLVWIERAVGREAPGSAA